MKAKTRTQKEKSPPLPFEFGKWQKTQDLFAKIIGANIFFLDPQGHVLSEPSRQSLFCSDLVPSRLVPPKASIPECVVRAFSGALQGKRSSACVHHGHFFSLRIHLDQGIVGVIVIGPIQAGKREKEETYRKIARGLSIDEEKFLDWVREIKVFSHTGITTVLEFLQEMTESFFKRSTQRRELEEMVPKSFFPRSKGAQKLFARFYHDELAHSLLEIALGVVDGNSGSVLLFDPKDKCFYIKAARGIRPEILIGTRVSAKGGIAACVARRRQPFLIHKEIQDPLLRRCLKRSEIQSSIVIPMSFEKRTLGVLCLNAESLNRKFNQDNLLLLNQLGKLASIGLAPVGTA